MSENKFAFVKQALLSLISPAPTSAAPASSASGTNDLKPLSRVDSSIPETFKVSAPFEQGKVSLAYAKTAPIITRDEFVKAINSASLLDSNVVFQTLNEYHLDLAKHLYSLFYQLDLTEIPLAIQYAKPRVNKGLFQYSLTLALLHRSDVKTPIPAQITYSPYVYFDLGEFNPVQISKTEVVLEGPFDFDHQSVDFEQRLDYYRLDPGVNAHHRHWHEAYVDAQGFQGVEKRDRGGELFYYMHQQMMARYNFERLSVGVPLVEALNNLHQPIPQPYFNKLTWESGKKLWDSRPPNQMLSDVVAGGTSLKIQDLETARDRILEAIDRGYVYVQNADGTEERKKLNAPWDKTHENGFEFERMDYGIDKLGDMVWAYAPRSINYNYYSSLHNNGHMIIGNCHDPKGFFYKQSEGSAMLLLETACRDPAFYRWHTFIDDIFERYKATLPEYKISELEFEGIRIENFDTWTPKIGVHDALQKNILQTKWLKDRVNITDGVDEKKKKLLVVETIYYDFIHLAHEEFEYKLTVYNDNTKPVKGVFRIFIAPIYEDTKLKETLYKAGKKALDEAKARNKYLEPSFNKLRRNFIELDKFVETLIPGENNYSRSSEASSVTVPIKQLFQTVDDSIAAYKEYLKGVDDGDKKDRPQDVSAWCGCGWPEYMLIGRGTPEGLPCHLFVMITDYEQDKIDNDTEQDYKNNATCGKASLSYCGVRDKLYPDKKPMGFPFDRKVQSDDLLFKDFVTKTRDTHEKYPVMISNMKMTDIIVKHVSGAPGNGPTIEQR